MSAGRREVVAGAWAAPVIAVGTPAPRAAASCDVELSVRKVTRCGSGYTVVLRTYTQKPRTITFIPGAAWRAEPESINVPAGYANTEVLFTPGKGKIFALSWVAVGGCRTTGCVTVDVRGAR